MPVSKVHRFLASFADAGFVQQTEKSGRYDLGPGALRPWLAGVSSVAGDLIPGLAAVAAPVLDWQQEIQASVTLIGTDQSIAAPGAACRVALTRFCQAAGFSDNRR